MQKRDDSKLALALAELPDAEIAMALSRVAVDCVHLPGIDSNAKVGTLPLAPNGRAALLHAAGAGLWVNRSNGSKKIAENDRSTSAPGCFHAPTERWSADSITIVAC